MHNQSSPFQRVPLLLLLGLLMSCALTQDNFKLDPIIYKVDFEVHHRLVHQSPDSSTLFLYADSDEYEVSFTAYTSPNEKIILAEKKQLISNQSRQTVGIPFKIRDTKYYIEIIVLDKDDNRAYSDALITDKGDSSSGIRLRTRESEHILPYCQPGQEFRLSHATADTIWIKYFGRGFTTSAPPFSDKGFRFNAQSPYTQLTPIPTGQIIRPDSEGLYLLQTNPYSQEGLFLNAFGGDYPRLSRAEDMVESVRYISKLDEYLSMQANENPKRIIEKFWMGRASDKDFAKELIKVYYTRVQIANRDFTSYKQGWKTDRGMMYIIFGPPERIHKDKEGEIWIYSATDKRGRLRVQFLRKNKQLLLVRSDYLKRPWDVEVYEWRRGILN